MSTYQRRVHAWMLECFGSTVAADIVERNQRFLEEALELVQACGLTPHEAYQLVHYVFSRPVGDTHQEIGGVRVCLAALCSATGVDEERAAEDELRRVWTKIPQIRAKQASKPRHSPLPQPSTRSGAVANAMTEALVVRLGEMDEELIATRKERDDWMEKHHQLAYRNCLQRWLAAWRRRWEEWSSR